MLAHEARTPGSETTSQSNVPLPPSPSPPRKHSSQPHGASFHLPQMIQVSHPRAYAVTPTTPRHSLHDGSRVSSVSRSFFSDSDRFAQSPVQTSHTRMTPRVPSSPSRSSVRAVFRSFKTTQTQPNVVNEVVSYGTRVGGARFNINSPSPYEHVPFETPDEAIRRKALQEIRQQITATPSVDDDELVSEFALLVRRVTQFCDENQFFFCSSEEDVRCARIDPQRLVVAARVMPTIGQPIFITFNKSDEPDPIWGFVRPRGAGLFSGSVVWLR